MTSHTDTDVGEDLKDLERAFRNATDPDERLSILYDIGVVIGGFPNARRAQLTIDRWHNRAVDIYDLIRTMRPGNSAMASPRGANRSKIGQPRMPTWTAR
jgi:hypothetical protein